MFQLSFCVFSQFTQRSVETWLLFLLTLLGFYAVKFQTRDTRNAAGSKSTNICSSCEQRPFQIYCFPNINPHHCNITPNNRNHLLGLSLIMMMSSNRKSTTLLSSRVAPGHRITFDVISIGLGRSWFKLISPRVDKFPLQPKWTSFSVPCPINGTRHSCRFLYVGKAYKFV